MRTLSHLLNAGLAGCLILVIIAGFGRLNALRSQDSNLHQASVPPSQSDKALREIKPTVRPAVVTPAPIHTDQPAETTSPPIDKFQPAVSTPAPIDIEHAQANSGQSSSNAVQSQARDPGIEQSVRVSIAAAAIPLPTPIPAPIPAVITKLTPAKDIFGAVKEPANLATRSIGFYAKGCLAGGKPLPVNGPAWQAMRLSRNRNWGHPSLVRFIERFANEAKEKDGWPGLLVGDMSMPRGGPMPFGHASHQVGLDVDIWYKPMPDHLLSPQERDEIPMESFLLDPAHVNPAMWTPDYAKLLRRAAGYPEVARIFVNPAIKKWLCDNVKEDRKFLSKITPIGGHHDHFHVRLVCPPDNPGCRNQAVLAADEGCGKGLDHWIEVLSRPIVPAPPRPLTTAAPARPVKPKPPVTMAELPAECDAVVKAVPQTASQ